MSSLLRSEDHAIRRVTATEQQFVQELIKGVPGSDDLLTQAESLWVLGCEPGTRMRIELEADPESASRGDPTQSLAIHGDVLDGRRHLSTTLSIARGWLHSLELESPEGVLDAVPVGAKVVDRSVQRYGASPSAAEGDWTAYCKSKLPDRLERVLKQMLGVRFPGSAELAAQAEFTTVVSKYESKDRLIFELEVDRLSVGRAQVADVPVEARHDDGSGITLVSLRTSHGWLNEIDIWRPGAETIEIPDAKELERY